MKESQTEELIMTTAKRIFFQKGNFHATTQDIADEAGVNRALIHYYFRSREHLLDAVLKGAFDKMNERLFSITQSKLSFTEKVRSFISVFIDEAMESPYLENFVVGEINRLDICCMTNPHKELIENCLAGFFEEMTAEMDKGTLPRVEPIHFIINLVSLCAYPISTRPLIQRTFGFDDKSYLKFIEDQKQVIFNLIFRDLK